MAKQLTLRELEMEYPIIYQAWKCRHCGWVGVYQAVPGWEPRTCWSLTGCRFMPGHQADTLELIEEGNRRVLDKYSQV